MHNAISWGTQPPGKGKGKGKGKAPGYEWNWWGPVHPSGYFDPYSGGKAGHGWGKTGKGGKGPHPGNPQQAVEEDLRRQLQQAQAALAAKNGNHLPSGSTGSPNSGIKPAGPVQPKTVEEIQEELTQLEGREGPPPDLINKKKEELEVARGIAGAKRIEILRKEIQSLEGISGAEALLEAKKRERGQLVELKKEAKPIGIRVKELERDLETKRRAVEKQKTKNEGILAQINELRAVLDKGLSQTTKLEQEQEAIQTELAESLRRKATETHAQEDDSGRQTTNALTPEEQQALDSITITEDQKDKWEVLKKALNKVGKSGDGGSQPGRGSKDGAPTKTGVQEEEDDEEMDPESEFEAVREHLLEGLDNEENKEFKEKLRKLCTERQGHFVQARKTKIKKTVKKK